ncbi:hypothetical protein [Amphritea sp.]|uniref:hypothetical protein n=1 Tax=Amphritea sp. TaxID=1872502 RepID=UPI003A8F8EEB
MEVAQILTIVFIFTMMVLILFMRGSLSKKDKERTLDFIKIANDLQMSTSDKVDRSFRNRLKPLQRFKRGRHEKFTNILHENRNNMEMVFFECFRGRSGGNTENMPRQVREGIFHFTSSDLNLPRFSLHEAEELQQIFVSALGYKDINFDSHPDFSKKYLLNGDDELAVNRLFSEKLICFIERLDGINIEGAGNQLIVYRPYTQIETRKFKQYKQEATQIFEQFRGQIL